MRGDNQPLPKSIQPIAWECECGGIVPVENISCSACGELRPVHQAWCAVYSGSVSCNCGLALGGRAS
jgi:hypothetical protein